MSADNFYRHGGDIFPFSGDILDFSINLNPLGIPPCAIEEGRHAMREMPGYPDPHCRALREAISRRDAVPVEQILCGNGACDLIDRLIRALKPGKALIPVPTFTEYEKFLDINDCKVMRHYIKSAEGFLLTDEILPFITSDIDLVFLCDPNNPTGRLLEEDFLCKVLRRCRETGTILAVDQCFLELSRARSDRMIDQLPEGGLLLLRALTKSYALAGLRVGYCLCADKALLAEMEHMGQPWAVSSIAQSVAVTALTQAPDWPQLGRKILSEEQGKIAFALREAGGEVFPSDGIFLLFRWKNDQLKDQLLSHGILIRQCGDFAGLDECYFRVAVRTKEENQRLIQALKHLGR